MKLLLYILGFVLVSYGLISCAKYKDPPHQKDPSTSPYCNDPNAVNYNWGFPGIQDSSVCLYLVDLFKGKYVFIDSVTQVSTGYYIFNQVDTLHIYALSSTQLAVTGFCSNPFDTVKFQAYVSSAYVATTDTIVGDSLTNQGQVLCRLLDTINGTMTSFFSDTGVLQISFTVYSDTGATTHFGHAQKIY